VRWIGAGRAWLGRIWLGRAWLKRVWLGRIWGWVTEHRGAIRRGLGLLVIGLSAAVAALTLLPASSLPGAPGGDKLHHLLAFGSIAFVGVLAWPRRWLRVVGVVVLYGGAIELIQPYVGRSGEWGDWIADALGAILGGAAALLLLRALRGVRALDTVESRSEPLPSGPTSPSNPTMTTNPNTNPNTDP
jgi:VanZ family protein